MSRPPQYENGIGAAGEPQGAPNVYHPQPEPPPSYDAYADPAIAHGWQNAYDETAELPQVAEVPGAAQALDVPELPPAPVGAGPRSRRKPKTGPWRSRRVALAAGAVGAVSVAALIAGFSLSGSSEDPEGKGTRTGSAAPEVSTEPASGASGETEGDGSGSSGGGSASASSASSAQPSATTSGTAGPSAGVSATTTAPAPAPTSTATQTDPGSDSGAGSDDKPGKGRGGTKRPR
ncbi:hypothetical protein [Streptomyces aquilus]|uniref:hypothetical protein n=1 Tax=Streptomyces aquilus TaxID=2548456 RepID=UPI0036BC14E4